MTPLLWSAAGVTLALLALAAWSFYAAWVEMRAVRRALAAVYAELKLIGQDMTRISGDQRGGRQQLANVIGMMLRAGFKRGPTRDWTDDEQNTQVQGEVNETQWNWRRPV